LTVIGYAPGAYDLFHIGHLNILTRAAEQCDKLIAGVVTDAVVLRAKGKAPVIPLAERLAIVRSVRYVDEAVPDPYVDKFQMWDQLRYDLLFKGDDWRGTEKGEALEARLAEVGARVVYFPYTLHTSSTLLRKMISMSS
jgi:glycerol-3-phosphate cytidylyltransferase